MPRASHGEAREPERKHTSGDRNHPAVRVRGHAGDHGESDREREEETGHPHRSHRSPQVEQLGIEREPLDTHVAGRELREQVVVGGP
jgi:hypothetical protein